jgi:diacylglycerol kinase (ATP)
MRQASLIYNPRAGPIDLATQMTAVVDQFRSHGWQMLLRPTRHAGHAIDLAKEAAARGDGLVVAAGGDGTLGDVANGLVGTKTIMAPLPVGTANSFARELHMPLPSLWEQGKLMPAVETLLHGRVHRMDVGLTRSRSGARHWLLWAGAGADGYVVDKVEPRPPWSKKLGRFGYLVQGFMVAPQIPTIRTTLEVDGEIYSDKYQLVVISNCRLYAGGEICLSPQAKLDDGKFEIWMFEAGSIWELMPKLVLARMELHHDLPGIIGLHGREVIISTNPITPFQTDGEATGHAPFTSQVLPRALRILIPSTAPPDLFVESGESLS